MKKVSVIVNPEAGQQQIKRDIDEISMILSEAFEEVLFYETEKKGDCATLVNKLVNHTDVIVSAGGDGTVSEVLNALAPINKRPILAIIPGGTHNNFAQSLGLSLQPIQAAKQIAEKRLQDVDIGYDGKQYFLNFCGVRSMLEDCYQDLDTAQSDFTRDLSMFYNEESETNTSFFYEISSKHHFCSGQAEMIIVANGGFIETFNSPVPNVHLNDGLLDVMILKDKGLTALSLSKARLSQTLDDDIFHFQTKELTLKTWPRILTESNSEMDIMTPSSIRAFPGYLSMLSGAV